jgi:hypothetical protein
MAHYPRQFSCGANNPVIALSETEVGKLFTADRHRNGFAHCHLSRPTGSASADRPGERYDNILLTREGLRLIDVGISALRTAVGDTFFDAYVRQELSELSEFRAYFLSRWTHKISRANRPENPRQIISTPHAQRK